MSVTYFDKNSLNDWFRDNGDQTHRLNYDLNENSIVFDLGGYRGDWSNDIFNKFKCNIYIFEPIKNHYHYILNKFKNNKKIKILNFAISNVNGESYIGNNEASSSIFINTNNTEKIELKSMISFLQENNITNVDLMKINIEGAEYDLLEGILDNDIHYIFDNIQIQFHKNIVNDYENRRNLIRKKLSKTHKITYDYSFVWENWKKLI